MDLPGMPDLLAAGFWGVVSGSALLVGALLAYAVSLPRRAIAAAMAFGAGVLISALSFDLMEEAFKRGGFISCAAGFLGGAALYTGASLLLAQGARHRKRSAGPPPSAEGQVADSQSGLAVTIGTLIDGIPESVAIGLTLVEGGVVSAAAVVAIFLSNVPESLSASLGLRKAGYRARSVVALWTTAIAVFGLAAMAGYGFFAGLPEGVVAATTAVAAGGILAMITDTMIPEAFEVAHDFAGMITVAGFLTAFALTKLA
ncbi:MAG TPA: hypothetical protein VH813_01365 [Candidatus Limnocylindrales bacterium]|jgi:ZIP family zinc transporter